MSGPSATIGGDNPATRKEDAKKTAKAAAEAAQVISSIKWHDQQIANIEKLRREEDSKLYKFIQEQLKAGTLKTQTVYLTSAGAFVAFVNQLSGSIETISVTVENVTQNEPIPF